MSKITTSNKSVLNLAMSTFLQKEFGSYFEYGNISNITDSLLKRSIQKLAEDLSEALIASANEPKRDSWKLIFGDTTFGETVTLGAKLIACASSDPLKFMCFLMYRAEEERREAKMMLVERDIANRRIANMKDIVLRAKSLREIRRAISRLDDELDDE